MNKFRAFCLAFLLSGMCSFSFPFDQYQKDTGLILDLLSKKESNKLLINTVVECLGKTAFTKGKSEDFLRCVNDMLHTDHLTNRDSVKFILGNYVARSSLMMAECYRTNEDPIYCLKAFGECLPLLLRNLFGFNEYSYTCKRLVKIPGYDKDESFVKDDIDSSYDDLLSDDPLEIDEEMPYDEDYGMGYDYDDEFGFETDDDDDSYVELGDMISERKATIRPKRHKQPKVSPRHDDTSSESSVDLIPDKEEITGEVPFSDDIVKQLRIN